EAAVMPELLERYKRMIRLRNEHPALRRGSFQTLLTDDEQDLFVFLRAHEGEELLVALNAGDAPARFDLPEGAWSPVYGGDLETGVVEATSGRVWKRTR
ncbi:MAG: DUF3459 domain-containing protein, partial [Planctomycetota bacterium]|nr:DUF3459 domain-containing protein [Planctomycetota bacterium]